MKLRSAIVILFSVFFLAVVPICLIGCGSGGSGGDGDDAQTAEEQEVAQQVATAAAILVTADLDSINPGDSTTIYASVYNQSGEGLEDVTVLFTLDDPTLAYVGSTDTTNSQGTAQTALTARSLSGTVSVTATYQDITASKEVVILDSTSPASISLSISPTTILVEGTATVTATVLDGNGDAVDNGTSVIFEVENSAFGAVTSSAVTNAGVATATFSAENQPGETTITASSGSAEDSIDITIEQAPSASIEFDDADPKNIAIAESGGIEVADITFMVKDSNGNPLEGINVDCVMVGPNGGEYIDASDTTPKTIEVSSDADGIATIKLHSGYVAGPVTIYATITTDEGDTITVESSVVSIGGGVPTMKWFSVAALQKNLPGLYYTNRTTDISAYLADRFGNFDVLEGTTVSFATEVGLAVDSSNVTVDEDGIATVVIRTQPSATIDSPENVAPLAWETSLQNYVLATYGQSFTGHPRDGVVNVLVYAKGEEHFNDSSANGIYDLGESFTDTFDDPFVDANDDGAYDDAASTDPEELYIDSGSDGTWDGTNGIWDENKNIFTNYSMLVTGAPYILFDTASAAGITIADGGAPETVYILICDVNLNPLTPGTSISITTEAGKVAGNISAVMLDTGTVGPTQAGQLGMIEFVVTLFDDEVGDTDPVVQGEMKVLVNWEGVDYQDSIFVSVD